MVGKGMEAERAAAMRVLRLRRAAGGAMATTSGGTITVADVSELESCASCAVMGSSSKDSSMESSEEEEQGWSSPPQCRHPCSERSPGWF